MFEMCLSAQPPSNASGLCLDHSGKGITVRTWGLGTVKILDLHADMGGQTRNGQCGYRSFPALWDGTGGENGGPAALHF